MISIKYVRFPATGAIQGSPIVYLAGGPGGSGIRTARQKRFPLFMAMREFGDVITFDQRGTGASSDIASCDTSVVVPSVQRLTDDEYAQLYRDSIPECELFWQEQGVDLAGYTTVEGAQDLDALRKHFGAEKITLWGISYGSHLALAALNLMEEHIDRVVLASAEGLEQTVKLPARTDEYFRRLQLAINTQPEAREIYPDIVQLISSVHSKLEEHPQLIEISDSNGVKTELLIQKSTIQLIARYMISDPDYAVTILGIYLSMDAGIYTPLANLVQQFYTPGEPISWEAMPLAMDVASGIGADRLALVEQQAATSLLGAYLNFPMPQVREALPELDLGQDFRSAPNSSVPTLLFSGTLDGRTYLTGQMEAVVGLENLTAVTVVNAGHNLYMSSPEVTEVIQDFMSGEPIGNSLIEIPLPSFMPSFLP